MPSSKKFIEAIQAILSKQDIDYLYYNGSDPFQSEYLPLHQSLRYYVTGFKGSMGELLIPVQGKVQLFVDGRYHTQAPLECDAEQVDVVKVGADQTLFAAVLERLKGEKRAVLGIVGDATIYRQALQLQALHKPLKTLAYEKLWQSLLDLGHSFPLFAQASQGQEQRQRSWEVEVLSHRLGFGDVDQCLERLNLPLKKAHFLNAGDDLCWLTQLRCFSNQQTSFFTAKGLVTSDHVYVFMPNPYKFISTETMPFNVTLQYYRDQAHLKQLLREVISEAGVTQVGMDESLLTYDDVLMIRELAPEEEKNYHEINPISLLKCRKPERELKEYRKSFLAASRAIAKTIKQIKAQTSEQLSSISELGLTQQLWAQYQAQGARDLSFNTIAASGPHGAIIHYSYPDPSTYLSPGQVILLDSGAYFDVGIATDCTRTFVPSSSAMTPEQLNQLKRDYTLVLKAQVKAESSWFRPGTLGNAIDFVARSVFLQQGEDFSHGLGHGVGLRVHEPGARLSPLSRDALHEGMVCSIEPGLYREGQWGIRLENVVEVKSSETPGLLQFESLVWVSWEDELIDWGMLDRWETQYIKLYQKRCLQLGTHTSAD